MCVVKSWAGAWTTSTRMHEPVLLPCIFGCRCSSDTITHYLKCGRLWRAVAHATSHTAASDPFSRLALTCDSQDLLNLVLAFTVYHTVKAAHLDVSKRAISTGDFRALASVTEGVALAAFKRFRMSVARHGPFSGHTATPVRSTSSRSGNIQARELPQTDRRVSNSLFDNSSRVANASRTRFVQGGDHFMSTTFRRVPPEEPSRSREGFFQGHVHP